MIYTSNAAERRLESKNRILPCYDIHLEVRDGLSHRDPNRRSLIQSGVLGFPLHAFAALTTFDLVDN